MYLNIPGLFDVQVLFAALARMPAADDWLFAARANRVGQVRHAWQVLGVDEWGRASAASPKI